MKFNERCSNCDEETEIDIEDVNRDGTFTCPKCGSKQLLCSMCGRKNCCSAEEKDCFRCAPCDAETMKHFDKFAYDVPHKDVLTGQDEGKMFGDFYTPYDVDKAMKAEGTEQVAKDSWNACLKAHGLEEENKVKGIFDDVVSDFIDYKEQYERVKVRLDKARSECVQRKMKLFIEDLKKIEQASAAIVKLGIKKIDNQYLYKSYIHGSGYLSIRYDSDGLSYLVYTEEFSQAKELACVEGYVESLETKDEESKKILEEFILNEYSPEDTDKVIEQVKNDINYATEKNINSITDMEEEIEKINKSFVA